MKIVCQVLKFTIFETIIKVDRRAFPHLLTIVEYVRKQDSLKKKDVVFSL